MSIRNRVLAVGLAHLTAIGSARIASADVVVFTFTGTVTQILDGTGQPRAVAPIPAGSVVSGRFAYALDQSPSSTSQGFARYTGTCNAWQITVNGLTFYAAPGAQVLMDVGALAGIFENFSIGTGDVTLPAGWSIDHSSVSDSYVLILQNSPPAGVLANTSPPATINIAQWQSSHELRMDFYNGVTFPGGQYTDRTTVFCNIQSIVQQPNIVVSASPGILQSPSSVVYGAGQTATLSLNVQGIGTSPPGFQWRKNGVNVVAGGRFQVGAGGAIMISGLTTSDMGVYDCVVNYGCGATIVGPVALGVVSCPADFNRSGNLTVQDIFDFLNAWFAGCP